MLSEKQKSAILNYKSEILEKIKHKDDTELTLRTPLENLMNKLRPENLRVVQEAKKQKAEFGTPDFKIIEKNSLIGFVECKKSSFKIQDLIDSNQIKKYNRTSKNILITNYQEFILLHDGKQKLETVSIYELDSQNKILNFLAIFDEFFKFEYAQIIKSNDVVKTLAFASFDFAVVIRDFMIQDENCNEDFYIKFNSLKTEYEKIVGFDFSFDEFSDTYSHSFIYALLLSKIENIDFNELENPISQIPKEFKLVREFLRTGFDFYELPINIKNTLSHILKHINLIDLSEIKTKNSDFLDFISIFLYEEFLKEFDKLRATENRRESGVYYTPIEAVDFIIRNSEIALKNSLKLKSGFLDSQVKVLDFATGTGNFLLNLIDKLSEKAKDELKKEKIKNKILNDIYGFELLITPYILAHLNIQNRLKEHKISLSENDKINVFLTNSIDLESEDNRKNSSRVISGLLPNFAKELESTNRIKKQNDILVIVGNPPYNSNSKNSSYGIMELLSDYKVNLNEKNIKPLNDDYIKFIRFAQQKIDTAGFGIVGVITNNSFLDGLVHRQMRKSLLNTFDEIYILNLHGNSLKKEGDKNIFDIQVGVSITIFVKHKKARKSQKIEQKIRYFSTLDNGIISREEKFDFLKHGTIGKSFPTENDRRERTPVRSESNDDILWEWQDLTPKSPNYWFVSKDESLDSEYNKFWSVTDIFNSYSLGLMTKQDKVTIQYTKQNLNNVVDDFLKNSEAENVKKYDFKDSRDWKFQKAKEDLEVNFNPKKIIYRPFDFRHTSLSKKSKGFLAYSSYAITQNLENKENLSLNLERIVKSKQFSHVLASNLISDFHVVGSGSYTFPLYIYTQIDNEVLKETNFTEKFQKDFLEKLSFSPEPEEILSYIYARLHSKKYREKYFELLKTDFPKVSITTDKTEFYNFAELGQHLIKLHTLSEELDDDEININGLENRKIEQIKLKNGILKLNKTLEISGITDEVFDFEIGSYKVLDKWLKYRKKDEIELSNEDLEHLKQTIIAIKETIQIMQKIDEINS